MKLVSTAGAYNMTRDDLLWAARMIEGEGGDDAATLYAMAQRFLFVLRPAGHRTFTSAIRAYSQPINPRWLADGDKCAGRSTGYCDVAHTSRRAALQRAAWGELPPDKTATVLAWSRGELPNPVPGAVDFADASTSSDWLEHNPGARVLLRAGNWYLATAESANRAIVQIMPGPLSVPILGGLLLASSIAGLVVGGTYIALRWRR